MFEVVGELPYEGFRVYLKCTFLQSGGDITLSSQSGRQRSQKKWLLHTLLESIVQNFYGDRVHSLRPCNSIRRVDNDVYAKLLQCRNCWPTLGSVRSPRDQ